MKYEMVVGLETHIELSTETKIFCGCTTAFGGEPNTHCCPVCTGQPGALPSLNKKVVEYAVLTGLATHCKIANVSKMDRKHYVYPDLPKAYQISQYDEPLCSGGYIELLCGKRINITRIHIEEDAGKLIHEGGCVFIDYNRGGVPLVEIVTEPDIRSAAEAVEYLETLQSIVRAAGVSDCRMQEGSMRCDVNISLRPEGSSVFGTRTEIKNLNSFTAVGTALAYEYERQAKILDGGGQVIQETRHFNADDGTTYNMRSKENADDYRYFPDPDIISVTVSDDEIEALGKKLPEMPQKKFVRYRDEYGISPENARLLVKYKNISTYFEEAASYVSNKKLVASLMTSVMFEKLSLETERESWEPKVSAPELGKLAKLLCDGKLNSNIARTVLVKMLDGGGCVEDHLTESDLSGIPPRELAALCTEAIAQNPAAAADYRGGKTKAIAALVGYIMKKTKGRADPAATTAELEAQLGR